MLSDLRKDFFAGAAWYDSLEPPSSDAEFSAWHLAKGDAMNVHPAILNVGLSFAAAHGLSSYFRKQFASLRPTEFLESRATVENRTVTFPIWEVGNELVVAAYLERVLGWTYLVHAPAGRPPKKGDWLFRSPSGKETFVEVKSVSEPMWRGSTGVFSRSSKAPRLRTILARAYGQLPREGYGTLIVLVALDDVLRLPHGSIMHGDLFEALFGEIQVKFNVMPYDPKSLRMGPSLREMFVQTSKHRLMGAAVGLDIGGFDVPEPRVYVIHNPFAYEHTRINPRDFPGQAQFYVRDSEACFVPPMPLEDVWAKVAMLAQEPRVTSNTPSPSK